MPNFQSGVIPSFLFYHDPKVVGPKLVGTTLSTGSSPNRLYPSKIFENELVGSGNYILRSVIFSTVAGGVAANLTFYYWPPSLQTGGANVNLPPAVCAIFNPGLGVDTSEGSTSYESIQWFPNLPIEPGGILLCISNVADNNGITLVLDKEI